MKLKQTTIVTSKLIIISSIFQYFQLDLIDRIVKQTLCEKQVIIRQATFLNQNQKQSLIKNIKIFRNLCTELHLQPQLDDFAIIPKTLTLLNKDQPTQGLMIIDILRIILSNSIMINKRIYVFIKMLFYCLFKLSNEQEISFQQKKELLVFSLFLAYLF
ncbi:unnamed protein product [Paramecium sonneborni]|uniref:Uncharacterized protein n=1 Tax=Paramecium sonneborni TaxID=65129 RepID=A0A8S1QZG5_9CILI|nr:unnamed protein product [Paramecium sonneborni]